MSRVLLVFTLVVAAAQMSFGQPKNAITATISSGQSLSSPIELRAENRTNLCTPTMVIMPGAWTAANLTFQVSVDGTNFYNLFDDSGAEVTVSASANRAIYIPAAYFWGVRQMRIRSGTSGSPVNQGASRQLVLVCRD